MSISFPKSVFLFKSNDTPNQEISISLSRRATPLGDHKKSNNDRSKCTSSILLFLRHTSFFSHLQNLPCHHFVTDFYTFTFRNSPQPEHLGELLETGGYLINGLPPLVHVRAEEVSKQTNRLLFSCDFNLSLFPIIFLPSFNCCRLAPRRCKCCRI